jgi:hypothetical protein
MWPFQKKSTWEKLTDPLTQNIPAGVAKTGRRVAGTIAGAVGMTLASAAISAARQRKDSQ